MPQKISQNIFHHNSNKCWSKFIKTGKHIRLIKLIKVIDNEYITSKYFSIILENWLPSYDRHWPIQYKQFVFYWTKKNLYGYRNFCLKCPPSAKMQGRNLQCHWLNASLTVFWLNRANSCPFLVYSLLQFILDGDLCQIHTFLHNSPRHHKQRLLELQ